MTDDRIIKRANSSATPEQIKVLEDHLNELAMQVLEQNIPAWQYDLYILAHGKRPIKVIEAED